MVTERRLDCRRGFQGQELQGQEFRDRNSGTGIQGQEFRDRNSGTGIARSGGGPFLDPSIAIVSNSKVLDSREADKCGTGFRLSFSPMTTDRMSFSEILARVRSIPFDRYVAASLIVLMLTTYRLWFSRDPSCPVIGSSLLSFSVPPVALSIVAIFLMLTAAAILVPRRPSLSAVTSLATSRRLLWFLVSVELAFLFVLDQSHLQPWAYLTFVCAMLFAADGCSILCLIRWVVISVYLWSGLGKLDFQFTHTVGQDFLSALTWGATDVLAESTKTRLATLMPIGEIFIAAALSIGVARRIVLGVVIAFHLTLIFILGPWALDHSSGVLAWNLVLIGQAFLLFGTHHQTTPALSSPRESCNVRPAWFSLVVVATVVIGPAFERSERWDHWLAWSLYAPHTSRAEIEIAESSVEELPKEIREFLDDDPDGDRWRKLDLGQWSLQRRGVPIYPQGRYQLEWIRKLITDTEIQDGVRVKVRGVADRVTGNRDERWLMGRNQILKR
jgi:hypothetical protein